MTDREERQHYIEVLKQMRLDYEDFWEENDTEEIKAFNYAIASIETDLRYDLLYEETSGQADKQADKPTTKNGCETCIHNQGVLECDMYGCKYEPATNLGVDYLGVDCISRAQAQTKIEMNASRYTISKERGGMGQVEWSDQLIKVSDAVDIIRHLSPVTPQEPRWIPVSERLPEDRREVLVTAYWHETYQVMMASYFGDGLWWCVPFNNCGEHMQRLKPKAWMPLPTPYEPQESEEI